MPDVLRTRGDRYEILREVGRGGMAMVYLARQTDLDRFVALKELGAFHASDPSFAQRFLRELRVAGSLSHPSIVTVHDYFEHDGTPYIAMEYVERGSLRPYVGQMDLAQVAGVLEGLLAGLAQAEQHGIVHRDLKPENLMVTSDGRVKIADFGIAKATTKMQTGAFLTATGTTVGTPTYMAPEQAMAQDIGPWTDLYSVGCMAFELFTGNVPFHDSDAPMAILLRHVNEPIPAVKSIDPSVDQEISDWIEKLLVKDPKARTQSANEAWEDFEEIVIGLLGPRWRRSARLGDKTNQIDTPKPLTPAPFEGTTADPGMSDEFEEFAWAAPSVPEIDDAPAPPPPSEPAPEIAADEDGYITFGRPAPPPSTPTTTDAAVSPGESATFQESEPITRRTPHLDLSVPLPLRPGAAFDVLVYADLLAARPAEETEDVVLRAPESVVSFRLDVWLVATHHFVVTDAPIKSITVRRDEATSSIARFRLAVGGSLEDEEVPLISASFSYNGRPSGRVTRMAPIHGAGGIATERPTATGATLEIDVQAVAPDLVMEISSPENDGRRFEVRVDTPLLSPERRTESWFLPVEAPMLVQTAMEQFFAAGASPAARLSSLEGAGLMLFDAAPALFKDVYWQLFDSGRNPRSLFVVSDERSIPWELVIPHRRTTTGDRQVHRPLGTSLAVGRWHRQTGVSPRQRVRLRSSYVVAPNYQSSARLEHATAEADFVCSRFSGQRIEPARFDHLDLTLGDQGVDLLHFICHGEAGDSETQVLLLEEPDVLNPHQIRAMPGLSKACRESRPLVFLNACEVGRPARGLVGASGFASSFIDIDASCVIASLWSVDDRVAHAVAVEFYEQILADPTMPFAEALRRIRERAYTADGEDTYAAYCFYGDPAASSA